MSTLLMTGTINSGYFGNVETKISDVELRKMQYYDTIEKYILKSNFDNIVFAENSDFPFDFSYFDELSQKHGKQFEYIAVNTDIAKTQTNGKSYGEAHLISQAVKRSKFINLEKAFYKVTGRVFVANINKLINNKPSCQFITRYNSKWCLTVFFKANVEVFNRCLADIEDLCNDYSGASIEATYYQRLMNEKVSCFQIYPDLRGVVGSTGIPYTRSKKNLLIKNLLVKMGYYNYRSRFYAPLLNLIEKKLTK
jgi:hypothetical protein